MSDQDSTTGAGATQSPRVPRQPPPVDDAAATRNGFIIIGVAVVLGIFLFAKGVTNQARVDTQASVTTTLPGIAGPPTSDRNAAPTTTTPGPGTVPTQPPTTKFPPKDIKVVVANGVDPAKTIAGPIGDKLSKAEYQVTGKVDLTSSTDKSIVYYTADLVPEAKAIAKVLGFGDNSAAPMPKAPPTPLNGAQFLVVVGKDHGSGSIP